MRKNFDLSSCLEAGNSKLVLAVGSGLRPRRLLAALARRRSLAEDLVSPPWAEALEAPPSLLASVHLLWLHREDSVSLPWGGGSGVPPRLVLVHPQRPVGPDLGAAGSDPQPPRLASVHPQPLPLVASVPQPPRLALVHPQPPPLVASVPRP